MLNKTARLSPYRRFRAIKPNSVAIPADTNARKPKPRLVLIIGIPRLLEKMRQITKTPEYRNIRKAPRWNWKLASVMRRLAERN